MRDSRGILSSGLGMVGRNKRYIFWFWLLNLTLAEFATSTFRKSAHAMLDHSLAGERLVHGFDLSVVAELFAKPELAQSEAAKLFARPEFGQIARSTPTMYFAILFWVATALFLPGVLQGYASMYRLPREDFFRACGRNLWRFIRLIVIAGIVMGTAATALFGIHGVLEQMAAESTNELLLPEVRFAGLVVIFLIMTAFRIWFDLAEADIVLSDQRAVLKSIRAALRHTAQSLMRLLASYVVATVAAVIVLLGGLWIWMRFVAPESVAGAFIVGQLTLLLLLIPRFWQRGVAVSYWQQNMMVPVVAISPITPPQIMPQPILPRPIDPPLVPNAPPEPQGF
jgi:hypothetical protein